MTATALRNFADAYVSSLSPGDKILFDQDFEVVRPIWHLIGGLLAKRGWRLSLLDNAKGWVVVENAPETVGKLGEADGIQATCIDYAIKPVAVPMVDNVLSDPDAVTRIQCRKCLNDWWRCGCRASMTFAKWDETTPMQRGGRA